MQKRILTIGALTALFLTAASVQAQEIEYIDQELIRLDYEDTETTGWTGYSTLEIFEEENGNHCYRNGNDQLQKPRGTYQYFKTQGASLDGAENWGLEFDLKMEYSYRSDKGAATFSVDGSKHYYAKNNAYRNIFKFFMMRQNSSSSSTDSLFHVIHSNASIAQVGDTLGSIELDPAKWYHYEFRVKNYRDAHLSIVDNEEGTEVFQASYTVEPDSLGYFYMLHTTPGCHNNKTTVGARYNYFDNFILYKTVDKNHIEKATAAITKVNNEQRQITFSNVTEGVSYRYKSTTIETDSFRLWPDEWTEYKAPFYINQTTKFVIQSYRVSNDIEYSSLSDTIKLAAGTTVKLNRPSFVSATYDAENDSYTATATTSSSGVQLFSNNTTFLFYKIGDAKKFSSCQNNSQLNIKPGQTYSVFAKSPGYVNSDTLTGVAFENYKRYNYEQIDMVGFCTYVSGNTNHVIWGDVVATLPVNDSTTYEFRSIYADHDSIGFNEADSTVIYENTYPFYHGRFALENTDFSSTNGWWGFRNNTLHCVYSVGKCAVLGLRKGDLVQVKTGNEPTLINDVAVPDYVVSYSGNYEYRVQKDGNMYFSTGKGSTINYVNIYGQEAITHRVKKGWNVWYNSTDMNIELPVEVQAYIVTRKDTLETLRITEDGDSLWYGTLNLEMVQDGIIPSAKAVLVKAESERAFELKEAADTAITDFSRSLLLAKATTTKITDSYGIFFKYQLGCDDLGNIAMVNQGYAKLICNAGDAYLQFDNRTDLKRDSNWVVPDYYLFDFLPGQEPFYYEADTVASSEEPVDALCPAVPHVSDGIIYDMFGRRYPSDATLPRGLYILDGKKIMIR